MAFCTQIVLQSNVSMTLKQRKCTKKISYNYSDSESVSSFIDEDFVCNDTSDADTETNSHSSSFSGNDIECILNEMMQTNKKTLNYVKLILLIVCMLSMIFFTFILYNVLQALK